MKRNLTSSILLILLIACKHCAFGQTPDWLWANGNGGSKDDESRNICIDSLGNSYVIGNFYSDTLVLGSFTLVNANNNYTDIFLVKYDYLGEVLWARKIGGDEFDDGFGICIDPTGFLYITGDFRSPILDFGNGIVLLNNIPVYDIFIAKYDLSGKPIWAKKAAGQAQDIAYAITLDSKGSVYIVGDFASEDLKFDTFTLKSSGSFDAFIAKYDSSGKVTWAKSIGGTFGDGCRDVCTDNRNNVYIVGTFLSQSVIIDSITLNSKDNDVFIVKFTEVGNVLWAKKAGGEDSDVANSICVNSSGNVYCTGLFTSAQFGIDGDTIVNSGIGADIFLLIMDTSGKLKSVQQAGGVGEQDYGMKVRTDKFDNLYLTGLYNSNQLLVGGFTLTNKGFGSGTYDIYLVKYDTAGTVQWASTAGGVTSDYVYGLDLSANGDILIAGSFRSPTIDFGSIQIANVNSDFSQDVFVAKMGLTTGIKVQYLNSICLIYPNPSNGLFTVQLDGIEGMKSIHIYDLTGKLVADKKTIKYQTEMDLRNLQSGIYLISVESENGISNNRFVISK